MIYRLVFALMAVCLVMESIVSGPGMRAEATQDRSGYFSKSFSLTGDYAKDIVAVAKAQLGKNGSALNFSEQWCSDFVCDCARLTKMPDSIVPYNYASRGACKYLYSYMIKNCKAKVVSSPQVGDFVFFDWNGNQDPYDSGHVALVAEVSGSTVKTIGGNQGNNDSCYTRVVSYDSYAKTNSLIARFVRPNYSGIPVPDPVVSFYYHVNGGTIASDSDYYADSDGLVRRKSDDGANLNNWKLTTESKNGLYNASTMKLTCANCVFLGWSMDPNSGTIYDQNDATVRAETFFPDIKKGKSGRVDFYACWGGKEMSKGAGRTVPDGEYWIVNGLGRGYLVDIGGDNFDTENGKNVKMHLWENTHNWGKYDVFTVTYLNNGFYSIKQRTTNKCIEVENGDPRHRTNISMNEFKNAVNQQWSITDTGNGYTIQARCNSLYFDVKSDKTDNSNLQVFEATGLASQVFGFVPYGAGAPIQDGTVCRIGTALSEGVYLNEAGYTSEIHNKTNLQLWRANGDNYFRFEYLNNGFYKIRENESGFCLDVYTGNNGQTYLSSPRNAWYYEDVDSAAEEWAVVSADKSGFFYIVNHLNGNCLTIDGSKTENGTNVSVSAGYGDNAKWRIVTNRSFTVTPPAKTEYTVGEHLELSGMKAVMVYSDGFEHNVTGAVRVSCDLSTVGSKTATVTYENGGVKNTAAFEITVREEQPVTTTAETTSTMPETTAAVRVSNMPGDADCSGSVDIADAILLARFCAEDSGAVISAQGKINADISGNGYVTSSDLTLLLEFLADIRSEF